MDLQERADYWAKQYGVDDDFFARLVNQESGWNPKARNAGSGAYGLTQVMPATAKDPGFGVTPLRNVSDPDEQLRFGAEYLSMLLDRYGGDEAKAAAAYNWGPGNADKWSGDRGQLPAETRHYLDVVLGGGGGGGGGGGDGGDEAPVATASAGLQEPEMVDPDWRPPEQTGLGGLMPRRNYRDPNTGKVGTIYADNMLGRASQKTDAFRDRLGFTDNPGAQAAGSMLQQLGQRWMMG